MNREKQILDYREPFNAPYMIRGATRFLISAQSTK